MIKRQTIAAILSTTAIAFSINVPAHAASQLPYSQAASDKSDADREGALHRRVREVLASDPSLGRFGLEVSSRDGQVTIAGTVTSEAQRTRAEELALTVEGVREVENLLELAPAS